MIGLILLGLGGFYVGWTCVSWSIWWAEREIWLIFCLLLFAGLVLLGLAWRATYYAALVLLGITTSRLAVRDFKNSIADWLFTAKVGLKD